MLCVSQTSNDGLNWCAFVKIAHNPASKVAGTEVAVNGARRVGSGVKETGCNFGRLTVGLCGVTLGNVGGSVLEQDLCRTGLLPACADFNMARLMISGAGL